MKKKSFIYEKISRTSCKEGFILDGKQYKTLEDLCHTEVARVTDDEFNLVWHYSDIYGRKVIYHRERVPCFDEHDRLHDNRHWNWFYFVSDFENPTATSLAVYFGDPEDCDWKWIIYEGLKNRKGGELKKLEFNQDVF